MKYTAFLFLFLVIFLAAGCAAPSETTATSHAQPSDSVLVRYDEPYQQEAEEKIIKGQEAKELIALLKELSYDPLKVCKCVPPITVLLEDGTRYGIDFGSSPHARLYTTPSAQADLTENQTQVLRRLLKKD